MFHLGSECPKSDRPPLNDSVSAANEPPHKVEEGEELRVGEARAAAVQESEGVKKSRRVLKNVSCLRVRTMHQDSDTVDIANDDESEESIEEAANNRHAVDWRTLRIKRLLNGENECRRSDRSAETRARGIYNPPTSEDWEHPFWGHRTPDQDAARDTIPTYADKCPTSIGDEPPLVADVETADIVEDTIELYILDTTMRKSIWKGRESEEVREILDAMSDLDEARTLRPGEEPSHGHFTNWTPCLLSLSTIARETN